MIMYWARSLEGQAFSGQSWINAAVSLALVVQTCRIRQIWRHGCMSRLPQTVLANALVDGANCPKAAQDLAKYRPAGELYEVPLPCSSPCRL